MKQNTYLDHAATSPLRPAAREVLLSNLDAFGNPSSIHRHGQHARHLLDGARRDLAEIYSMRGEQVVFTSGGTEANNLALRGVMAAASKGAQFITTATEHSCIMATAKALQINGTPVTFLEVNANGNPNLTQLEEALKQTPTALVSIHTTNNETGVMPNIRAVATLAHQHGAFFHTDAVQSPLNEVTNPAKSPQERPDLITISGHKFGGLKGAGALLIHGNPPMEALITGGAQERNRRAGTEAVLPILTQTEALKEYINNKEIEEELYAKYAKEITAFCAQNSDKIQLIATDNPNRAPHIFQFHTPTQAGEDLVMTLDIKGFSLSQGSACTSGRTEPSHVLKAMNYSAEAATQAIRLSLGHTTEQKDVKDLLNTLKNTL